MRNKKSRDVDAEDPTPENPTPEDNEAEEAKADEEPSAEKRIAQLEARCEDLNTRWLRAQADYQNLRRRSLSDLENALRNQMQPLLEELVFVLDFLDMALASPATTAETKNLVLGVEMTRKKFVQALENADLREIPTDGEFDPGLHEATATRPAEDAVPGSILETIRKGYTWREHVLRHAQVVVAADPDSRAASQPKEDSEQTTEAAKTSSDPTRERQER